MQRFDRAVATLSKLMAILSAACAGAIMLTMSIDVANRLLTGRSIRGAFELVETLVILVVFLGLAYAERSDTHVRVTLVTDRLGWRSAEAVRSFGNLVAGGIVAWFAFASWQQARTSVAFREFRHGGIVEFPIWPARIVVAAGFTMLAIETFLRVTASLRRVAKGEAPDITGDRVMI